MTSDRLRDAVTELDAYCGRYPGSDREPDLFSQIAAVTENAGSVWTLECLEAIRQVALRHREFTVEDLDGLIPPTYDLRAVGGVMLEAARRGYCRKLGWVGSGAKPHGPTAPPVGLEPLPRRRPCRVMFRTWSFGVATWRLRRARRRGLAGAPPSRSPFRCSRSTVQRLAMAQPITGTSTVAQHTRWFWCGSNASQPRGRGGCRG
jgi:hypothetical protein